MILHTAFPDFILFLYVHLSHADSSYDPTELAAIKEKMKKLFPAGTDFERKLYGTLREYNSFDKARLSELFRDSFEHFNRTEQVAQSSVFDDLHEIIRADGKVIQSETNALETLKQFIDLTKQ
jgi:hypothetical protein